MVWVNSVLMGFAEYLLTGNVSICSGNSVGVKTSWVGEDLGERGLFQISAKD